MKLKTYSGLDVESSEEIGKEHEVSLTKSTSAHIMRALSNTIYKDKPGSMVREITSNAWDANKEAGSDEPVILEIRNNQLIIKDQGPGFSEERIEKVFINFGESTKRDSNDEIGGFGIGSKTPLAYTSDFTLRTWVDGMEYVYLIHKTESLPKVKLISKNDAPGIANGTEVIIAIKPGDRSTIERAIIEQLLYFDNLMVFGVNGWDNDMTLITDDEGTFIYNETFPPRKSNICLGQVAYPLDEVTVENACQQWLTHKVVQFGGNSNAHELAQNFMSMRIGLKADIGDIPVILSREEIEYDDGVENTIMRKIGETLDRLEALYLEQSDPDQFKDTPIWDIMEMTSERSVKVGDTHMSLSGMTHLQPAVPQNYKDVDKDLLKRQIDVSYREVMVARGGEVRNITDSTWNYSLQGHYFSVGDRGGKKLYNDGAHKGLETYQIIFINDGQKLPTRKIKYYSKEVDSNKIIRVIRLRPDAAKHVVQEMTKHGNTTSHKGKPIVVYEDFLEEFQDLLVSFGAIHADSIEVPKGWGYVKPKANLRMRLLYGEDTRGIIKEYKDFGLSNSRSGPWVLLVHKDSEVFDDIGYHLNINIAYCAQADYDVLIQTEHFMTFEEYLMQRREFREELTLYYIGSKYPDNRELRQYISPDTYSFLPDELMEAAHTISEKLSYKHFQPMDKLKEISELVWNYLNYVGPGTEYHNFLRQDWIKAAEYLVSFQDNKEITEVQCIKNQRLKARIYLKLFLDEKITHEYIKKHLPYSTRIVKTPDTY